MRVIYLIAGLFLLTICSVACTPPPATIPPSSLATPTASFSLPITASPTSLPISTPVPPPLVTPSPSASPTSLPSPTVPPTAIPLTLCSPLKGYTFEELPDIESQPFAPNHPGKDDGHQGVDFAHWQYKDRVSLEGAEVQAVLPGIVAASIPDKYPYGNMILIETPYDHLPDILITTFALQPGQSLYHLYAHLGFPSTFTLGDPVHCGDILGLVGNTGASGNPHLHFETRTGVSGVRFGSMEYYKTTSTDEERANYESWRFKGDFILWDPWVLLRLGGDE